MKITKTAFSGLLIIEPKIFYDSRGYFYENFQHSRYRELGLPTLVQDNMSRSKKNVLRGLHYQLPHAQGKLVWVGYGSVLDVVVDIRVNSPTFGKWFHIVLDDQTHKQLYVPPGFAHGFCVLSDYANFYYKCSEFYSPADERGIIWNDPTLNIPWPTSHPFVSDKDQLFPQLADIPHDKLFS